MRTTVDIDEDILRAAKDLARERNQSLGRALSDLARRGLLPSRPSAETQRGLPILPRKPGARAVTSEIVSQFRDNED